jgi:hypothetical protein
MKKFIQYLDSYKNNTVISDCEYMNMVHQINLNYLTNQVGHYPLYYPTHFSSTPIEQTSYYQWQQNHEAIFPTDDILYDPLIQTIKIYTNEKCMHNSDSPLMSIK